MKRQELRTFATILNGTVYGSTDHSLPIVSISVHSDRLQQDAAFFALAGSNTDGHRYVPDAFRNGAIAAVVNAGWYEREGSPAGGPLIVVEDTLAALQRLAAWWREQLGGKVVGITGSNGKTMVKDALLRVLSTTYRCTASPGSYNSQLGVPLAILGTPEDAEVALYEAGISVPGEMARLETMIRPDYGILTNLGWSHIAAFGSREAIAAEKTQLFGNIRPQGWTLIPGSDPLAERSAASLACRVYRFGLPAVDLPQIMNRRGGSAETSLHLRFPAGDEFTLSVDTVLADAMIDIEIAICSGWLLGVSAAAIVSALTHYSPPPTRLEVWKSPGGVTLVNDTENSDPLSVQSALRTLETTGTPGGRRLFLYGESVAPAPGETAEVGALAARHRVDELLLVGDSALETAITAFQARYPERPAHRFDKLSGAKQYLLGSLRWGDALLVKGYGLAGIDQIARDIVEAMAPNRFYLDLKAVAENVARLRRLVGPHTRLMAMLKALAYGSDAVQLARALQQMGIDQIGVSSADEGRQLRDAGIHLPILVMMCTPDEVEKLARYSLIPVIYSFEIAAAVIAAQRRQDPPQHEQLNQPRLNHPLDVHIEVDTGMGRLGVLPEQVRELVTEIESCASLRLQGLMTHFAVADDPAADEFTRMQLARFQKVRAELAARGYTGLVCHAAATAGAIRFPDARLDMVRIGIGLYGVYPSPDVAQVIELVPAVALVSRIVKITAHRQGDRIGYGGTFTVPTDGFRAAVIPMGYHDGFPWNPGNVGHVLIAGSRAPLCGRISMDSLVVDVSDIPDAAVGMDALLYGERGGHAIRPEEVARLSGTIAYELLARLGPRVQRIFLGS